MGCNSSHELPPLEFYDNYKRHNLPEADIKILQNEFEKEAFMTINMIRADPKSMVKYVKQYKKHKSYKGQPLEPLITHLNNMIALSPVTLDENACKACRINSEKKNAEIEKGKDCYEKGGNKDEFRTMAGNAKDIETEECTQISWQGTPIDLIIQSLVNGYTAKNTHPILDSKLIKVGLSFKHHKKLQNICQLLYVK